LAIPVWELFWSCNAHRQVSFGMPPLSAEGILSVFQLKLVPQDVWPIYSELLARMDMKFLELRVAQSKEAKTNAGE
jgi:hypothetical protein